jgi:BirA family biotin operon repressor/biotin-[acetyl-CoA-carboxylase] ligase
MINTVLERCSSTNDLLKGFAQQGCPHGAWISAQIQEKGRGRWGRSWKSVKGNLYLSVLFRNVPSSCLTWVPLGIASFLANHLRSLFGLDIVVKWPNDLWLQGAKLGGILCESVFSAKDPSVIVGIGLNCFDSPHFSDRSTTSLTHALGYCVVADDLRMGLLESILRQGAHWEKVSIQKSYEACALFQKGSEVVWGDPQKRGVVVGLGEWAELVVFESSLQQEVRLLAEEPLIPGIQLII